MRMKILSIFAVIAAEMLLLTAQISPAASATWTGSGNQHWSNPADWTPGGPLMGPAMFTTYGSDRTFITQ